MLEDELFCNFLSERISDLILCKPFYNNLASWWDFLKESVKSEITFFAKEKSKRRHRERVFLTNRLIVLKRRLTNDGETFLASEITLIEAQLSAINAKNLEGAKIRSQELELNFELYL